MDSSQTTVSLIIPVYNEERYLPDLISAVSNLPFKTEIVAVDDGSSDGSPGILKEWEKSQSITYIAHQKNRGKGAAIRTGFAACSGDIVVIQDADLEYDPADLESIILPIQRGYADVVYGSRMKGGKAQRVHLFWHLAGNKLLTLLTNVLYNTTLSDMETGYKAFKGDLIRSLKLESDDFRIEPELTAKILRMGVRVFEVPISYYGRDYGEGKKITWKDAFPAIVTLIRLRFQGKK